MTALDRCRLYAFVDTAYLAGRPAGEVARQLADGGADIIQLRAKNHSQEQIRKLAGEILPVTRAAGIPLVINDEPRLAFELGAEYCHLGQEDFFDAGWRHVGELWGKLGCATAGRQLPGVGLSSHAPAQAQRALQAGPAYIAIGPVFATATKPGATPVTLEYVRWAAENVRIPWFAIGGINLSNLEQVLATGARRVAVVSAILCAPDVSAACREFKRRLEQWPL